MVSAALKHNNNSSMFNLSDAREKNIEETQFDYIVIRKNLNRPVQHCSNVFLWFSQSEFVGNLNFSTIPSDRVFQKERFILKFALAEKYKSHFALLRGFFQFRKPPGLFISADRSDKSFAVEFSSDIEEKSIAFFETVFHWLYKEVRFKDVLKEVIRFEQKIHREQALLLSALQTTVR